MQIARRSFKTLSISSLDVNVKAGAIPSSFELNVEKDALVIKRVFQSEYREDCAKGCSHIPENL